MYYQQYKNTIANKPKPIIKKNGLEKPKKIKIKKDKKSMFA